MRWLPVPEFEDLYEVSDTGLVRRTKPAHGTSCTTLKPSMNKGGHLRVTLSRDAKHYARSVHRLVLGAFVGPCPDGMECRHLNGVPDDNRLANLAWGTHSENTLDRVQHGVHPNASKTHCKHNHEFTPENTVWSHGQRFCLACRKRRNSKRPTTRAARGMIHRGEC